MRNAYPLLSLLPALLLLGVACGGDGHGDLEAFAERYLADADTATQPSYFHPAQRDAIDWDAHARCVTEHATGRPGAVEATVISALPILRGEAAPIAGSDGMATAAAQHVTYDLRFAGAEDYPIVWSARLAQAEGEWVLVATEADLERNRAGECMPAVLPELPPAR